MLGDLLPVIGIGLVASALALLLKSYRPEMALLVGLGAGCLIFFLLLSNLSPALSTLESLVDRANIQGSYTEAAIKCLGICYVTQLGADTCRDAGQSAVAGKVELAGRISVLVISLPMFTKLADMAFSLITI
ncbi:MAG TPA: stage III sporulation AC/AD family protein [Firmicutes bacterium]|nr:stage III sporulation AC/AD family protein [Bacillota bacterium]